MLNFSFKNTYNILENLSCIILILFVLLSTVCGKKPSSPPADEYGSLEVTTIYQENLTDSLILNIDDKIINKFSNPCLYSDIFAGRHKIFAFYKGLYSKVKMVDIKTDKTAEITLELNKSSPYKGNYAPDFWMTDIEGNTLNLEKYHGKAILLFFMEYT